MPFMKAQTIPNNFFGINAWMPDTIGNASACVSAPCILYGKLHSNWQKIKDSRMQIVRFGGIAPDKNRPTNYQYIKMIDSIRVNGMEPVIQVPYYNGYYTASQAAAIVQYINVTKGKNIKYWIIGNEPNLTYNYTSASQVAPYIRSFASAMKAVDPSILIIGPEFAGFQKSMTDDLTTPNGTWDITGRDANGRFYIDIFSYHTYPMGNGNSPLPTRNDLISKLTSYWSYQDELIYLNGRLAAANSTHTRTGTSALKAAVTEANVDYLNNSNDNLYGVGANSFIGAQFVSEMYGIGLQQGLAFISLWSTIEGNNTSSNIGFLDSWSAAKKPLYYHMKMMAENFKGAMVSATDNQTNVKTFAAKSTSLTNVLIMNQDASVNYTYTVRLNTSSVTAASALKINVNAGLAVEYTDVVQNQSSIILTFDANGNLVKKTDYNISTHAANNLPPAVTMYGVVDLVVNTPTASAATASVGSSVSLGAQVFNGGTSAAVSSKLGFYLSTDSTFSAGDILLASATGASLAAQTGVQRSANFVVPQVQAGSYYLIYYADHLSEVAESNEANNRRAIPFAVTSPTLLQGSPDLRITALAAPAGTFAPGSAAGFTATVQNNASVTAGAYKTGLFLSADSVYNSTDLQLASVQCASLAANGSASTAVTAVLPSSLQAGTYFIVAFADHAAEVTESSELNNTASKALQIAVPSSTLPDLRMTVINVNPTSVTAGNRISITSTITNSGSNAASSKAGYYLSTDMSLDAADQFLGFADGYSLAAGASAVRTATVKIPMRQYGGMFYVLAVADYVSAVQESNEQNNTASASLMVYGRKDNISYALAMAPVSAGVAGGTITASEPAETDIVFSSVYSSDGLADTGDVKSAGVVFPGGATVHTFTVPVPAAVGGGMWYFILSDSDPVVQAPTISGTTEISGNAVTSIGESGRASLNLYPNPTNGRIHITLPDAGDRETSVQYQLLDITGKILESRTVSMAGDTITLDFPSGLIPGAYVVKLNAGGRVEARTVLLTN
jgi:subtilase family serine protease